MSVDIFGKNHAQDIPKSPEELKIEDAKIMENTRKGFVAALGLPETTIWEEAKKVFKDKHRSEAAIKRGLSETATYEEINAADRKLRAVELGLPENATDEEMTNASEALLRKEVRKEAVIKYGLPETATDEEINTAGRKRRAIKLGLPETASEESIRDAGTERLRIKYIKKLGLSETATWDEIQAVARKTEKTLLDQIIKDVYEE